MLWIFFFFPRCVLFVVPFFVIPKTISLLINVILSWLPHVVVWLSFEYQPSLLYNYYVTGRKAIKKKTNLPRHKTCYSLLELSYILMLFCTS